MRGLRMKQLARGRAEPDLDRVLLARIDDPNAGALEEDRHRPAAHVPDEGPVAQALDLRIRSPTVVAGGTMV